MSHSRSRLRSVYINATPSGTVEGILGGAATYFAVAASYFTAVRVVAVVGEDFTDEH